MCYLFCMALHASSAAPIWDRLARPWIEWRDDQLAVKALYKISMWVTGGLVGLFAVISLICHDPSLACFRLFPFLIAFGFSLATCIAAWKYRHGTTTTTVPMVLFSLFGGLASSSFAVFHFLVLPYALFAHLEARLETVKTFHPLMKQIVMVMIFVIFMRCLDLFGSSLEQLPIFNWNA